MSTGEASTGHNQGSDRERLARMCDERAMRAHDYAIEVWGWDCTASAAEYQLEAADWRKIAELIRALPPREETTKP